MQFTADTLAGDVVNKGTITTGAGGTVILAGTNVSNEGLIKTPQGQTILAAGQTVQLEELGAPGFKVEITGADGNATNLGQILAEAGDIGVVAAAVKNSGTLDTSSIVREGGRIFLKATQSIQLTETSKVGADGTAGGSVSLDAGFIAQGGRVSADGNTTGGSVQLTTTGGASLAGEISAKGGTGAGGEITLDVGTTVLHNTHSTLDASGASGGSIREIAGHQITSSATYRATGSAGLGGQIDLSAPATKLLSVQIDASGASGGGRIRLGGEYQGGKNLTTDELPNAETLAVSAGSVIRADATKVGAGGTAILWSDLTSALYADVSARPAGGGAGGFIELSSADRLTWGGTANAGPGGQVLMDPKNIVIQDAASGSVQYNLVLGYNYLDLPRMKGQNLEASDSLGRAVSLSGTQLAVGALGDDGAGNVATDSGAVYLFNNPFGTPSLSGVIGKGYTGTGNYNLSALEANDNFGISVSLSGTQLAVGAFGDAGAGNVAANSGAVYLFNTPFGTPSLSGVIGKGYTGAGNHDLSALEGGDRFGSSVSLSGTQLAVGAYGDAGTGNVATNSGAVYLFNTPFSTPSLSGVIGKGYTGAGNYDLGALEAVDVFGNTVSLSGTQLAVGASLDDGAGNVATDSGAVYLFNTPFGTPSLAGVIGKGYTGAGNYDLNTLEANDYFGHSVSLSGTQLAVGAFGDDGVGNAASVSGAVYLFNNPFSTPSLSGVIGKGYTGAGNYNLNALGVDDSFGSAVSLSGTQLAVGANGDDGAGNVAADSGAVYLFNNPFSTPSLAGVIGKGYTATGNYDLSALEASDRFGSSVSLSGTQLAVGAYLDDGAGNLAADSGAVYLFNTPFGTPSLSGVIGKGYTGAGNYDLSTLEADDHFCGSVSLSGTQLAVGANGDDGAGNVATDSGAVYLFNTPFGTPSLTGVIGKGYSGAGNYDLSALAAYDYFGTSVSLSGTQLVVGAVGDDGASNTVSGSGAVYLINTPFGTPSLAGVIGKGYTGAGSYDPITLAADDMFGESVSLSGTQLAVGANADDGVGNVATDSGAVYLFNNPFSTPSLSGVIGKGYTGAGNYDLTALEAYDQFGGSVSLFGTQLAVGANADNGAGNVAPNSGAVYLFNTPFGTPSLAGVIGKGYTGAGNYDLGALEVGDLFGWSVSLSGTQLAVGSLLDAGAGNVAASSGAVYLFNNPFSTPSLAGVIGKGYSGTGNFDPGEALAANDKFGSSVSLSGTQLAVGAIGEVYLFNNPYSTPSLSGMIGKGYTGAGNYDPAALEADDNFGISVSLSGTQLAVGANHDDGDGNAFVWSGAVYLFNTPFATPSLAGVIGKGYTGAGDYNPSTLVSFELFGTSVSLSGTQLAVGASSDSGSGNVASQSGAVYLFNTPFSTPSLSGVIGRGYNGAGDYNLAALEAFDNFGSSVSLSGTQLAVGAINDDGAGNVAGASGAVYLFNTPFGTPTLAGVIGKGYSYDPGTLAANDLFGSSVSLSGTQLAVGAYGDAGATNVALGIGAVYLYNTPFATPTLAGVIGKGYLGTGNYDLAALEAGDGFGYSVSLSGTRLAVGAYQDAGAGNAANNSGAVYLFTLSAGDAATGQTFATNPSANSTITPASITAILNTGSSLTLQANNDITVTNAITANNTGGNGGALTLQAGRSILINANITTDNGNFTAIANDTLASGVVDAQRDAGAANITMAGGTSINAGSGNIVLAIRDGAGLTNNTAGAVTLGGLAANNWLVYAPNPASVTKNGLTSNFRQYNTAYGGTINGTGNGFIYASTANLTVNTTLASGTASHTFGANPTAVWGYSLTGFADSEDNAGNVGVGGTAAFSPVMASSTAVGSYTVGYLNGLSSSRGYGFVAGTGQAYSVAAAAAVPPPATPTPTTTPASSTVMDTAAPLLQASLVAVTSGVAAVAPSGQASPFALAEPLTPALPLPSLDPLATSLTGLPTPTLPGGNIGGVPGYFGAPAQGATALATAGGASVPGLAGSAGAAGGSASVSPAGPNFFVGGNTAPGSVEVSSSAATSGPAAVILDASGNVVSPIDTPIEFLNFIPTQNPLIPTLRHVSQCSASS